MERQKDEASVENKVDDEDYIEFCFRRDGKFDVIKHGRSLESEPQRNIHKNLGNSRPVNRKLNYNEDAEQDEEEDLTDTDRQQKRDNIRKVCQSGVSGESRDSNQSEGSSSTGSFAFPVLGWEWSGSPVQLPKSESVHRSKHKVKSLRFRFQCCTF